MITTLTIIFFILLLLIVVFFVIGSFRLRGKTVGIYEKLTSYLDNKLEDKTKKIENFSQKIVGFFRFGIREILFLILKNLLDILHIVTRKVSIQVSKIRSKYYKKKTTKEIPSSPSEYLREVGENRDK